MCYEPHECLIQSRRKKEEEEEKEEEAARIHFNLTILLMQFFFFNPAGRINMINQWVKCENTRVN